MAIIRHRTPFEHRHRPSYVYRIRSALPPCSDKLVTKMAAAVVLLLIVVVVLAVFQPFYSEINVLVINAKGQPIHKTNEHYLSVALDSSLIADGFNGFNMSDPVLHNLMKPLARGYLRIGGTMADRLIFKPHDDNSGLKSRVNTMLDGGKCAYEEMYCSPLDRPNFTMSGKQWLELNDLSTKTGLTILFDLNCLIRTENGTWNSNNAEQLVEFSDKHNLTLIWQLGNEPNSFKHVFNYSLSPERLAEDFVRLKQILQRYPRYADSLLVGPDVTRPKPHKNAVNKYLKAFLENSEGVVNAVTWHQYYFNGRDALLYYFLNADIFNLLQDQIDVIKSDVKSVGYDRKPLWLSETSSAYGGGAPGLSDRFVAMYIWLDKLGLAAKNGLSVVIRQSLYRGHYALIGDNFEPNPDWWLSVLYKKLVGHQVVECFTATPPEVRMYCHCAAENASVAPAVVVFGINMKNSDAVIRIQEVDYDMEKVYEIENYILQTHISLISKLVFLNEQILTLINGTVPAFVPKNKTGNVIRMPPFSLGFWVLRSPSLTVCK